ncbi:MAG: hypothetical protein Q7T30_00305 [Planctomycetota bacterium]|nr:hypothetical protein [Planctomycetota bacterium]
MADSYTPRVGGLLVVAVAVTTVVTVLRVVGELQGWDAVWFSTDAGGGFAGVGILWLAPLFGFLFGRRVAQGGSRPPFVASFFVPMFGLAAIVAAIAVIGTQCKGEDLRTYGNYLVNGAPIVALLALFAWPRVCFVNLAYAMMARAPVMIVQYLDAQNPTWQTHYGKVHPELPAMGADERLWMLTQAQLGLWIPFTVLLCGAFAALGAATVRKA